MTKSVLNINKFDFLNLLIVKGANFSLVATIFFLVRIEVDTAAFIDFGFYWGLALMIGGVLFGGLGSTLVRLVSVSGSIQSIVYHPGVKTVSLVFCAIFLVNIFFAIQAADIVGSMLVSMIGLGAIIQLHLAIMSILRAVKATKYLFVCASAMFILVTGLFLLTQGLSDSVSLILRRLLYAYFISAIVLCFVLRFLLNSSLVNAGERTVVEINRFKDSYVSFTLINIFSYAFVMIDFHILRALLDTDVLSGAGVAKIYFDRFVIPLLSLVTGVVSLNILRAKTDSLVGNKSFTIKYDFNEKKAAILILLLPLILLGYYAFSAYGDSGVSSLGYIQAALVLVGYFCFSLNGVFFDVFVIRYNYSAIFIGVLVYLSVSYLSYYFAISIFGLAGWVGACFLLNCTATCFSLLSLRIPQAKEKEL